MAKTTVELEGTKELSRALDKVGERAKKALGAALFEEAESIMAKSKMEVPVDTGTLRQSGFVRPPRTDSKGLFVTLGYGGAAKEHAVYVHEGTGPAVGRAPFRPPARAFVDWVRRHGASPEEAGTLDQPGPAAFRVAKAVGERGLQPTKFLERPLRRAERGMARRIARRVRRAVERV